MKKEIYILFTAGRGPVECGLAVHGIQNRFKKYLDAKKVAYEIVSQKKGSINKTMNTILFKVHNIDKTILNSWIGTLQWICKSPIRKFHKRKNWYIKSQVITPPKQTDTNIQDVTIQAYRASGPGGQHRNKVETAIRIIHNPTGIIVTASDGKSQAQNKKKAQYKLEAKLKDQRNNTLQNFNLEQWTNQIEIERGNPVKTYVGLKFE